MKAVKWSLDLSSCCKLPLFNNNEKKFIIDLMINCSSEILLKMLTSNKKYTQILTNRLAALLSSFA